MATNGQMELYFCSVLRLNTYILPSGNLTNMKQQVDLPQVKMHDMSAKEMAINKLTHIGVWSKQSYNTLFVNTALFLSLIEEHEA